MHLCLLLTALLLQHSVSFFFHAPIASPSTSQSRPSPSAQWRTSARLSAKPPKPTNINYDDLEASLDDNGPPVDKTKPRDGRKQHGKSPRSILKRAKQQEQEGIESSSSVSVGKSENCSNIDSDHTITVPPPNSNCRLDKHLQTLLPNLTRSQLQSLIKSSAFGDLTKTSKVSPSSQITYTPPSQTSHTPGAPKSTHTMKVLYKSSNIAVLSKPYNTLTHVGEKQRGVSATSCEYSNCARVSSLSLLLFLLFYTNS